MIDNKNKIDEEFKPKAPFDKIKNFAAFTLAEVLITLAIIGVVAALTIPTVMKNYRNHEIEVKLKKVYTELSQAINRSIVENGPMNKWEMPYYGNNQSNINFFDKYLIPYLKVQKNCIKNYNKNNCPSTKIKQLSGKGNFEYNSSYYLVLHDGTILHSFCNTGARYCWLFADINGFKAPNTIGLDVFVFNLYKKNWLEFYYAYAKTWLKGAASADNSACAKTSGSVKGMYCGFIIHTNGWKIPTKDEYVNKFKGSAKDYPW